MRFAERTWGEMPNKPIKSKKDTETNLDKYNKMFKTSINEFTHEQRSSVI